MAKMVKAKLNGEFEIILPEHRAERPDWYTEEGWEKPRLKALHKEILRQKKDGVTPVVYYVGAEEGEMPALCQMWGAKVVMFEPNPLVLPNVKAIWEANKLKKPLALFVGFASNVTDLSPPRPNPLAVGFTEEWPEATNGEVIGNHGFKELYLEADAFPQIRLDDVAKEVSSPTIISFDCEGSEWQVMKGAEEVMNTYKPTIFASISPEFMFHQFGQYSRDFRNWIMDHGYKETLLDYKHELHTLYEAIA
jgi:FkbM family methyltransferase